MNINNVLKKMVILPLALVSISVSGCAKSDNTIYTGDIEIHDPYEDYNRAIFQFNDAVDDAVIHPVVRGYRTVTPEPARKGLRNVLRTLKSPVTLANEVMQGDVDGSANVVKRTIINVFVGGLGLFDVAGYEGIEYEQEDFGQTLGVWGVGHGPYLVVPILGPSSVRDYAGYFADGMMDPLRWYLMNVDKDWVYFTKVGLDYLTLRDDLMDVLTDLEASSIDYYAAVRSTYYQRRQALTEDRAKSPAESYATPEIPDYDDDF